MFSLIWFRRGNTKDRNQREKKSTRAHKFLSYMWSLSICGLYIVIYLWEVVCWYLSFFISSYHFFFFIFIFISFLLPNSDIIVNLYKLYFLSSHFSSQPNKRVFILPIFLSSQPNTYERKLNLFFLPLFYPLSIFYPPTFPLLKSKEPLSHCHSNTLPSTLYFLQAWKIF